MVIEATGVSSLVFGAMAHNAAFGVVCLTGVSPSGRPLRVDAGGLNRDIVLGNDAVIGSVNAGPGTTPTPHGPWRRRTWTGSAG